MRKSTDPNLWFAVLAALVCAILPPVVTAEDGTNKSTPNSQQRIGDDCNANGIPDDAEVQDRLVGVRASDEITVSSHLFRLGRIV